MNQPTTLALFCKVVDNYGDIGICWRLARQLAHEHGIAVTLWVDDLKSFARIHPGVDATAQAQQVDGVAVYHWRDQEGTYFAEDVADIVIEFFAVDLPPGYVTAMAQRQVKPVWLNLEGLTAEEWVEGCHTLPSMHPRLPLTKHFFFPGFTAKTGGLLREAGLLEERDRFQRDPVAVTAFLGTLGLTPSQQAARKVSLFCYPHAPAAELFDAWRRGGEPVTCLVPEGVVRDDVRAFLGAEPVAGASRTDGPLTVRVLPFVPQPDYDRLLWACDVNIVRGEDSFVRAQWANRPFAWHIYPQDENLHLKKLRAFIARYCPDIASLEEFTLRFNGAGVEQNQDWLHLWQTLSSHIDQLACLSANWQKRMLENGDLASNLLSFAGSLR
ncbi:putative repeat protein (TIGR03837 family) [Pseudoduganella flava]|uniref:Protein-arginine rhamnosyltransferase n=1 Tax=Pseudoduganella flava TaxID=871742 RepID=A0A562PZV3_9BURK|nr:elongation factor P maturation arginine rhamnosyltransferase EarP [Pseudoduganella flava]QGZ42958.1 elongation factor P maturation arginine rhamnosyltransferase EarP [Pseudoduganella flava]TWI49720.1 putative repeat protein (TIGR03837 family) [Pseudoduganella flava]